MKEEPKVCVVCDCVDDEYFQTPAGIGPFCSECWESLIDPDQHDLFALAQKLLCFCSADIVNGIAQLLGSLLLEKRVAAYEVEVERLRKLLTEAAATIESSPRDWGGKFPFPSKLVEEVREVMR